MITYRGTDFGAASPGRWIVTGPFSAELHPRWFRLGLGLSQWCVAVYLGPVVLAVGRRRWRLPTNEPTCSIVWTESTTR